jgi:serine/threonine-protein kinase RsbW
MHDPPAPLDLTLAPAAPELARLLAAVEAWSVAAGLAPNAVHRLGLVVEELAANVAMHAAKGTDGATLLAVRLAREADAVRVVIEDDGRAYDPLARAAPDTGARLEDRAIGGLGVHLTRALSRSLAYRREGGRNRVTALIDSG